MDWDNDGKHDLLIGDADGNVYIFLNTTNNMGPVLDGGHILQTGGAPINVGIRVTPITDDWNGDGKKDMLAGNMDGNINIFINKGTDSAPVFDSPYLLQIDSRDFDIGTRSAPRISDWNKDGLKDLLVGEMEGYVYYLKNVGTNNEPVFKKAEKLFLRSGDFLRYPDPGGNPRSRLFVVDWNNDGLDDMLVGGRDGKIMLYIAAQEPLFSLSVLAKKVWNIQRENFIKLRESIRVKVRLIKSRFRTLFKTS